MIKIKQHTYLLPIINTLIPSYANISENCEKFPLKKIPIEIWDWVKEAPCAWLSTSLSRAPRNMRIECRKWYNESYWQPSRSIEQATHFPIQQLHYNFNCMIGAMVSVRKTANLSISLSYTTLLPMSLCPVFWYFFFLTFWPMVKNSWVSANTRELPQEKPDFVTWVITWSRDDEISWSDPYASDHTEMGGRR